MDAIAHSRAAREAALQVRPAYPPILSLYSLYIDPV